MNCFFYETIVPVGISRCFPTQHMVNVIASSFFKPIQHGFPFLEKSIGGWLDFFLKPGNTFFGESQFVAVPFKQIPLVATHRNGGGMLHFLQGRSYSKSLAHEEGGHESPGTADAETAVNENLAAGVYAVRRPGQRLFQLLQRRGFFIRDWDVIHIECGLLFAVTQIVAFSAQVDDSRNSLRAYRCQVIMRSGCIAYRQLGGYPSDRVFLHFSFPSAMLDELTVIQQRRNAI